jgi:rhamnopyranosyl-N-acetylglucosaminyl-diphospho-decaprenol beta-1,3/1,4-galactofuranosyltransferase
MKILATIVTHNRCSLLERCIEHLEAQERQPEGILVVNNASTDGTIEMLVQRGIQFVIQENVGSAGGWHRGIKHALEHGYDAVWLMDDDGYPDKHSLEKLVPHLGKDIACVSSIVVRENDPSKFVFPFPVLDSKELPVLFAGKRKITSVDKLRGRAKDGTYEFAHLFNGALINIQAVRQIGNVNTDYFIFGDEVDYFFRLRKFGPVCSVLNAIHYHPDVTTRPYTPHKIYYYVKNTLILNAKYFDQVLLRNISTIVVALWRTGRRNSLGTAFKYLAGGENGVLYRAIRRGLAGSIGKDYEQN